MATEFDLIKRFFSRPVSASLLGGGDDCALFGVTPGLHVATSTDLLLEGRHFFSDVDPRSLGHKALAVNLSDLAAMGARPLGRVIQEHIKKPLAEELLFGKLTKGGTVHVGVKDGALHLTYEEPQKPRLTGQKPPLLTAE